MHTHTCTRSMLPLSSFYLSCRLTAFCAWDSSPVSWSPLSADEVLAEMCAAQWVTLHNIYRPFFLLFGDAAHCSHSILVFDTTTHFVVCCKQRILWGSGNKTAGWLGNTGKLSASPTLTVVYHNYTHIHRASSSHSQAWHQTLPVGDRVSEWRREGRSCYILPPGHWAGKWCHKRSCDTELTNHISVLQSATFDYNMVYNVARAISDEVRSKVLSWILFSAGKTKCVPLSSLPLPSLPLPTLHLKNNNYTSHGDYDFHTGLSCWSPVLNILRDPRWGRNQVKREHY